MVEVEQPNFVFTVGGEDVASKRSDSMIGNCSNQGDKSPLRDSGAGMQVPVKTGQPRCVVQTFAADFFLTLHKQVGLYN